ncbi:uncharacterized protein [Nerophis lumbriciformis]|uniref:uncharacterized protein n=1 Tax=Nerophis lumbriciformis TaxID=546530 RepID=UPI002AE07BB9|nr:uncharacterized protein LOC133611306 [Nerophis lumbriciformis]
MQISSSNSGLFNYDTNGIHEKIWQRLLFSLFSENAYTVEKMHIRQFVLMKQWNKVPGHITVDHMKQWLLAQIISLDKFQRIKSDRLQAWIRSKFRFLNQLEKEVCKDLIEEMRLSQLLGRRVTLEGVQLVFSVMCPGAERLVETSLQQLFHGLQALFNVNGVELEKLMPYIEFQLATAHLLAEVVNYTVSVFLNIQELPADWHIGQDPTSAPLTRRAEAPSVICRMLKQALTSCYCLSQQLSESRLVHTCIWMVCEKMTDSIFRYFAEGIKSSQLLDFDQSFFIAPGRIMRGIKDMVSIVMINNYFLQ